MTYDNPPKNETFDEQSKKKLLAWWFEYGQPYRREQIERFQRGVKNSRVVELHGTTHGGFVFEEKQQAILIREMRRFLVPAQIAASANVQGNSSPVPLRSSCRTKDPL